jgi:glutaminase
MLEPLEFGNDPVDIVNGYIRQCSILVTVKDLVRMGSVLANGGLMLKLENGY